MKAHLWRVDALDGQLVLAGDDVVHVVEKWIGHIPKAVTVLGYQKGAAVDWVVRFAPEGQSVACAKQVNRGTLGSSQVTNTMH